MTNRNSFSIFYSVLFLLFGLISCKHDPHPIEEKEEPKGTISLSYSKDTITVTRGETANSTTPTIEGNAPISFQVFSDPQTFSEEFSIDTKGVVSVDSTLTEDLYDLTIIASNEDGNFNFDNILAVKVVEPDIAPADLTFSKDTFEFEPNQSFSIPIVSILGSTPITYSMSISPFYGTVSINENTGEISCTGFFSEGIYNLSVTATNEHGSTSFNDILVIKISNNAPPPITFDNDISPIISANCGGCHTGGGQTNYTSYTNASNNINALINRINRDQGSGGFMPSGGTKLSQENLDKFQQWLDDGLLEN